ERKEEIGCRGYDARRRGLCTNRFQQHGRRCRRPAREWDGKDLIFGDRARKRMPAIDDLTRSPIVTAPKRKRLMAYQRRSFRRTVDEWATLYDQFFHSDSSRTTLPSTAELTQSFKLPNVIFLPSNPGV